MPQRLGGRPDPSAQGSFAKTPFPHVLLSSYERKLTGTIEVRAPSGDMATLVLTGGRPAKVRTTAPVAYLGRVLLELGNFDDRALGNALLQADKSQWLIGQALVSVGAVDTDEIEPALVEQLRRRLHYIAHLPAEAEFTYYDALDALASFGALSTVTVDPYGVVWAAVREAPSWEHVRGALARIESLGLRLASNVDLARFQMSKAELAIAEAMRKTARSVGELMEMGIGDPRQAQLVAYGLLISKQVEVISDGHERPSMPDRSPLSRLSGPVSDPASRPTPLSMPAQHPPNVPPSSTHPTRARIVTAHPLSPTTTPPPAASAQRSTAPPEARPAPGLGPGPGGEALVFGKEQLDMQMELADRGPAFEPLEQAAKRFREAQAFLEAGELRRAETAAKVAAECRLDSAEYLAFYGWIAGKLAESKMGVNEARGRVAMELAIEKLDKAIRMDPTLARAHMYRGALRVILARHDEAVADLRRAVELNPNDADAVADLKAFEANKAGREQLEKKDSDPAWRKLFRR
jgi:hypothetical protein